MKPRLWFPTALLALLVAAWFPTAGCSSAQTKTVVGGIVKIGVDWCAEEAQQPSDPAWIALVCSLVSDVSTLAVTPEAGTAHVVIPRAEWTSMKAAASADAGGSSP